MKPLVIYHANCTDGFGAAFAAWLAFGDNADYLPMNYGQEIKADGLDFTEVYILDFSFPRPVMEALFTTAKRVIWLDHHKTAFEMWCPEALYEADGYVLVPDGANQPHHIRLAHNKSGAMLAWEFFHPDWEVPKMIQFIDDRDRWQWKLDGSAEFHAALGSWAPWSFEQWRSLWRETTPAQGGSSTYLTDFLNQGHAILRAQKQHVERIAKQAVKCEISFDDAEPGDIFYNEVKYTGLAVNTPIFQSEVGHELANASGSFGLCWSMADSGRARCSFRSNGEYDVSAIARVFGGGGHKSASGCTVSIETLLSWLR